MSDDAAVRVWADELFERSIQSKPTEDDFIELKREPSPDYFGAARQLAGMLNAARGSHVLYVFGVDEDTREIRPVAFDAHSWVQRVFRHIEGDPPPTRTLLMKGGATGLVFDPVAAPYVLIMRDSDAREGDARKATREVPFAHEVPWRELRITRSATRDDLCRLLVPILRAPEIEVFSAELRVDLTTQPPAWNLTGSVEMFVVPVGREPVSLPAHRVSLWLKTVSGDPLDAEPMKGHFEHRPGSLATASNSYLLHCTGPGVAKLEFTGRVGAEVLKHHDRLALWVRLRPAPEGPAAQFRVELRCSTKGGSTAIWRT